MPLGLLAWIVFALVVTTETSTTFKVGLVCDKFLKYAEQDILIYNGTLWWANWVNSRGGLVYLFFKNKITKVWDVYTIFISPKSPHIWK
jgi:hypothetical protein